jgi:protocatechuate 3,4-dioxygenase beta subunit
VNSHLDDHRLDDDAPVGRVLTRREALALLGLAGSTLLAGCVPVTPPAGAPQAATATLAADTAASGALPACVVRPEQTEGPYFVDEQLNRADVRVDPADGSLKEGVPLTLGFSVAQIAGGVCTPLAGATVDIWHCDALGVYSGVRDPRADTTGQTWLRGYQVTDDSGRVEFTTIYPGWYGGRAVHIHFKIRATGADGQSYDFTSQLYFDEAVTAQVYRREPYASRGQPNTPNAMDGPFRNGGDQLLLDLTPAGEGYATLFSLALDLS